MDPVSTPWSRTNSNLKALILSFVPLYNAQCVRRVSKEVKKIFESEESMRHRINRGEYLRGVLCFMSLYGQTRFLGKDFADMDVIDYLCNQGKNFHSLNLRGYNVWLSASPHESEHWTPSKERLLMGPVTVQNGDHMGIQGRKLYNFKYPHWKRLRPALTNLHRLWLGSRSLTDDQFVSLNFANMSYLVLHRCVTLTSVPTLYATHFEAIGCSNLKRIGDLPNARLVRVIGAVKRIGDCPKAEYVEFSHCAIAAIGSLKDDATIVFDWFKGTEIHGLRVGTLRVSHSTIFERFVDVTADCIEVEDCAKYQPNL